MGIFKNKDQFEGYNIYSMKKYVDKKRMIFTITAIIVVILTLALTIYYLVDTNIRIKKGKEFANQITEYEQNQKKIEEQKEAERKAKIPQLTEAGKENLKNIYHSQEKTAYLTFDDGPSNNTHEILDILKQYNIKATFFVLGSSIDANEGAKDILKEEVKRGHAIANHTYGHDYSYLYPGRVMNVKNILSDLEKSQNAMKAVLGKDFSTRVIRFPGGYWSWEGRTAMKEALEQNQYYNVDWNALNKDAEGTKKNAEQLVQCAKESVKALGPDADSVVLLMHDTYGKDK